MFRRLLTASLPLLVAALLLVPLLGHTETYDACFPQAGCQRVAMPVATGDPPAHCDQGEQYLKGAAGAGNCATTNNNTLCICTVKDNWTPMNILGGNSVTATLPDPYSFVLGTTTGLKIGTATTQKLGFYNATPIVQPAATTEVIAALTNLGLLASGTHTLAVPGVASFAGDTTLTDINLILGTATGTKVGTATSQKLGFFNATPIVQPAATVAATTALANLGLVAAAGAGTSPPIAALPAAQTIAATNTIAADACGGLKQITSAGAVTTNTTDTFTAPAAANTGCVMAVCNIGANNITLDNNAHFFSAAAGDITMTANDCVSVASNGTAWYQVSALIAN